MEEEKWSQFTATGKITDYLDYKGCVSEKKHSFDTYLDYGGNYGIYTCIPFFAC